ncbi:hypothetical protein ABIE58_003564, partial [Roseovarius sp. MBR-78]
GGIRPSADHDIQPHPNRTAAWQRKRSKIEVPDNLFFGET